ncbi:hypothetical protein DSO57_1019209 [Entomophthora muscae]|uniref:Uncharacterized protein n=1 Tax=Entomophthora muscae TaxID=34485 RepID=A0ACC2U1V2_9FUNG|nr:hypothetical protein DSO57_1019209 [Entomophthora muscae]
MFLNISIALNLHLAILLNKNPRRKWEYYYWYLSFGLSLLINSPLLVLGIFGLSVNQMCFLKQDKPIISMIFSNFISIGTSIYCITISIIVVIKMRKQSCLPSNQETKKQSLHELKCLICRTCLYPAICFIAYIGSNCSLIYIYIHGKPLSWLKVWAVWGYSTRGTLHLLAFLADPVAFTLSKDSLECAAAEISHASKNQMSTTCEFSYNYIVIQDSMNPNSPELSRMMAKYFQRYI